MANYAVRLSIFDGENAPFITPVVLLESTNWDAAKAEITSIIDQEADAIEKNGYHAHIVAELITNATFFFDLNKHGELTLCDQNNPH